MQLRKGFLVLVSITLTAAGLASSAVLEHSRADALTVRDARVYDVPIIGGPANRCGANAAHPGVFGEGEAMVSSGGKMTVTTRTRYDAAVATAMQAYQAHFNRPATCQELRDVTGKTEMRALYDIACKPGALRPPLEFCRLGKTAASQTWMNDPRNVNTSNWNLLNMDIACGQEGPTKYIGWQDINVLINTKRFWFIEFDVRMHHLNSSPGVHGRLVKHGADAPEFAYGKVLTAAAAEWATVFMRDLTREMKKVYVNAGPYNDNDLYNVWTRTVIAAGTNLPLLGTSGARLYETNRAALCRVDNGINFVRDVVDQNYRTSMIGLDQVTRDLFSDLQTGSPGTDIPCQEEPAACKPTNIVAPFYAIWDSTPAGWSADRCRAYHGIEQVRAHFRTTACR